MGTAAEDVAAKMGAAAEAGPWRIYRSAFLLFAFGAVMLLVPGGTFHTAGAQDTAMGFDAAYRFSQGQLPGRDFIAPLGILAYALPGIGLALTGTYATAFSMASVLAALFLLPILAYVLAARVRFAVALPLMALVLAIVLAPHNPGEPADFIFKGMYYNHYCWGALVTLFCLWLPRREWPAHAVWAEGALIALLFAFLFYQKISYAVIALAFLGLWAAMAAQARRRGAIGLAGFAVIAVILELALGIHGGYFRDIAGAAQALDGKRSAPGMFFAVALLNYFDLILLGLGFLIARQYRPAGRADTLMMLFMVAGTMALVVSNSQSRVLVGLLVPLAFFAMQSPKETSWLKTPLPVLWLFVIPPLAVSFSALLLTFVLGGDGEASARAFAKAGGEIGLKLDGMNLSDSSRAAAAGERLPQGFDRANPLRSILETSADPKADLFYDRLYSLGNRDPILPTEYFYMVLAGAKELERLTGPDTRIHTFDMANPFPFLLDRPPPEQVPQWFDKGVNISAATLPPPEVWLGRIDVVMVPAFPHMADTRDLLLEAYGDYLSAEYERVHVSPYWAIWQRRETQG